MAVPLPAFYSPYLERLGNQVSCDGLGRRASTKDSFPGLEYKQTRLGAEKVRLAENILQQAAASTEVRFLPAPPHSVVCRAPDWL